MSSTSNPAADLGRRQAATRELLEQDPSSALEEACSSAKWILQDLYRRRFSESPGNRRFLTLLDALEESLPRRIRVQLKAIASYRDALVGGESDDLHRDDVRPCVQAVDVVVQWYVSEDTATLTTIPEATEIDTQAATSTTSGTFKTLSLEQGSAPKLYRLRSLGLLLLTLAVLALYSVQLHQQVALAERRLGVVLDVQESPEGLEILALAPNSPAEQAGIQVGDRASALDGKPVRTIDDFQVTQEHVDRGTPIPIEITRGDEILRFELSPGLPIEWMLPIVNGLAMIACSALAILVLFRRRIDLRSRLLGNMLWLQAFEVAMPTSVLANWLDTATWAGLLLIAGAQMGVDLHLASIIPERQRWLARRPWMVGVFYGLGVLFWGGASVTLLLENFGDRGLPWTFELCSQVLSGWVLPLWPLAVLGLLGYPALRHPSPDGRLQARIVWLAFIPWTFYIAATTFASRWQLDVSRWTGPAFPLLMLCFPGAVWAVMELESKKKRRILLNLVREIRQARSLTQLSRSLARDLDAAFHPQRLQVFLQDRDGEDLTLVHSTGDGATTSEVPLHFGVRRRLGLEGGYLLIPEDLEPDCPTEELVWLDQLGARVLVSMRDAESHLVGVLALGAKRSEEIYTGQDLEMLMSLAGQIALAAQNLGLQSRLDQKTRIQREVLDRFRDQKIELVQECPHCGRCYDHDQKHCTEDGQPLSLSVPVERTVRGRYRLDRTLGRGGIGSVYAATDLRLDRRVAVKVLLGSALDDPVVRRRFEREARIVAQLTHPNIVTLYDCGTTSVGNAFIVLELLEGRTLRRAFRDHPQFDPNELADCVDQILYALMAAHSEDIVHRDLKPGNVFLTSKRGTPTAKLLDFGIAKIKSVPMAGELTSPGVVLGTQGYMAPEQILGDEVDERADLYSVAVMVVEGLTGQRPRRGDHPLAASEAMAKIPIEVDGVPETRELARVLRRALARRPADRFPNAEALREVMIPALRVYPSAEELEQRLAPARPDSTEKIELTGSLGDSIDELRRQLRRRRRR